MHFLIICFEKVFDEVKTPATRVVKNNLIVRLLCFRSRPSSNNTIKMSKMVFEDINGDQLVVSSLQVKQMIGTILIGLYT